MRGITRIILGACLAAFSAVPAGAVGTFVGPEGSTVQLEASRSLLIRYADRVQMITQVKYAGTPADFVWLLAIPNVPNAIDNGVRTAPAPQAALDELSDTTHPVLDAVCDGEATGAQAAIRQAETWGPVPNEGLAGRVFEARDIENGDLDAYLATTRGYVIDDALQAAIADTVDQNFMFVAVHIDTAAIGVNKIDPIISVTWPEAAGPTRIGTRPIATALPSGVADLVIWTLDAGRTQANLTTRELDLSTVAFTGATDTNYLEAFDADVGRQQGQVFITEFGEPVSNATFESEILETFRSESGATFLTRLRARMAAAVFRTNAKTVSFNAQGAAAYGRTHTVEGFMCGGAVTPDQGVSEDMGPVVGDDMGEPTPLDMATGGSADMGSSGGGGGGGGCTARPGHSAPWPWLLGLLLPIGLLSRRRRR